MKKFIYLLIILFTGFIYSCTETEVDEISPIASNSAEQEGEPLTRSGIAQEEPVLYEVDPADIPIKMQAMSTSAGDNLHYNLDRIAEAGVPIQIKSRLNNYYVITGTDSESTLGPLPGYHTIKTFPYYTGIPYKIYATVLSNRITTKYSLAVGYYTNNPNEKIVMKTDYDSSEQSVSWDFISGTHSLGSFLIESQSYLGQGSSNPWDVFQYVWQVNNSTKLRYGQPNGSTAQQFYITFGLPWRIETLTYPNPNYSRITNAGTINLVGSYINTSYNPVHYNITLSASAHETSSFVETKTGLQFDRHTDDVNKMVSKPTLVDGVVIAPTTSSPADVKYGYQGGYKTVQKTLKIYAPRRTKVEVTYAYSKYNVETDYEATIKYSSRSSSGRTSSSSDSNGRISGSASSGRERVEECICKLVGSWSGTLFQDDYPEPEFKLTDLDSGEIIIMSLPTAQALNIVGEL